MFDAAGVLTSETQLHADKSKDVYLSNLTGRSYVAEHDSYDTAGLLVEATRTHADGSLDYHYVLASDGTKTVDQFDAEGTLTLHKILGTDGSSTAQAYTGGLLTREIVTYAPGGTEVSNTKVFDAAGVLTSETQLHADKSKDVYLSNLTGRSYVAEHDSYDTAGLLVEATRTHADGSLDYHYVLASDGTKTIDQFDANGKLTLHKELSTDGSSKAQAYVGGLLAREVVTYAPGGTEVSNTKVFNAAGVLTSETQLHADKSKDVYLSNLTGRSYVAEHDSYDTAGLLVEATRTHADGSLDYHYVLASDGYAHAAQDPGHGRFVDGSGLHRRPPHP
ncbi:hypothetical protein ASG51_22965 [Methylobacterium sp. Leaf465]|nr:hypothetical protein ASG51_22965 [Methylobacterium sp. Leaf465]